jgi:signal transduction histidine kinase
MKIFSLRISAVAAALRARIKRKARPAVGHLPDAAPGASATAQISVVDLPPEIRTNALAVAAAGLAHDINNLLTLIIGNSQLALKEIRDLGARRRWTEVLNAAEVAAKLCQEFVALGRSQVLDAQPVSPNTVIRDALELLERLAGDGVAIKISLAENAGSVRIHATALLQALMNLVLNAREAMPSGGIVVLETARKCVPAAANGAGSWAGRFVVLTVSDNGIGMDDDTRSRAFEVFFSTKAAGPVTGLGLATVSAVVRKAGGHVEWNTQVGVGTAFHLYFPVEESSQPKQNMATTRLSQLYSLEHRTIDSAITERRPGVYTLDRSSEGWFTAAYVGRSDHDLNASLHQHVGRYRFFKYAFCASPEEAFEAECDLYHEHHPRDNPAHPVSPSGMPCPACGFAG